MTGLSRRAFLIGASALGAGVASPGASWGAPTIASANPLRQLQRSIRGRVVLPSSARYEALAIPRNLRFAALMPKAVVLCADAQDVARSLRWTRETGMAFAIRGGGHNWIDGSSSAGIVISTRAMRKTKIQGNTLRVQAGAQNADLGALLPMGGTGTLLLPGGNCPNVGLAGLTLGGGIGPNAPWAGLTADHLREVTMVTADGDILTASARRNPDLFWALRGGAGGNFGVVTDLTYDLVEVPVTRATTFLLDYAPANATASGMAWQRVRVGNEDRLGGTWAVFNDANGLRARVRAQVLLGEADARALMAPLLDISTTGAQVVERTWWDTYAWYQTAVSPSNTFWDRSLYADADLGSDALDALVSVTGRFPQPEDASGAFIISGWVGGRVSAVAPDATAYVHRPARSLLEPRTGWPNPQHPKRWPTPVPPAIRGWMDELWESVLPHSTGRSYQNFPDPGLADPERAYFGGNLRRLRMIKSAWDPDNVFRYSQSITPAS